MHAGSIPTRLQKRKKLDPLNVVRRRDFRCLQMQALGEFFRTPSALADVVAPQGLGKSCRYASMGSRSVVLWTLRSRAKFASLEKEARFHPNSKLTAIDPFVIGTR